ncbi:uncharacterized protein BT62DRAFT_1071310 [Guyanagaster necrorhizus]|uniref:Uncharacterized protein n=1 Tax=Guyanagaster necrorhizus TaxID=856835 RepID=A0A9P8AYE8_9AGAR|nr:uncharacterized protein BT62DRAFT_1071310 [Guyanagaster necrorhizus MCA 3950]KAG7452136.1 hypothetical protein BT62DRAFT_1071310 [Guyanagaster necrorhizus MCA 3950]
MPPRSLNFVLTLGAAAVGVVSGLYIFEPLVKDAANQSHPKPKSSDPVITQVDVLSDHKSVGPSSNSEKQGDSKSTPKNV